MNLEKARNQALLAAIAAMIMGVIGILCMTLVYLLYGEWLNGFAKNDSDAATNAFLVKVIQVASFRLIPSLSIILIAVAASMLYFLKKEMERGGKKNS